MNQPRIEICVLSGGLSRRMGQDKAQLRLHGRTLLARVRAAARATGLPTRVIRRDKVPRCGPLGGVHTALQSSSSDALVFLACDMPLIEPALIRRLIREYLKRNPGSAAQQQRPVFVMDERRAGFPFILGRAALPIVARQIERGELSLQSLARALKAVKLKLGPAWAKQIRNLNTPEELKRARKLLKA
jgi:molybdopterin-guanine dinucleotide biosynthesis protein A